MMVLMTIKIVVNIAPKVEVTQKSNSGLHQKYSSIKLLVHSKSNQHDKFLIEKNLK